MMPDRAPGQSLARGGESELPFSLGAAGVGVADLQARLARAGYWIGEDRVGEYGPGTAQAVRAFQRERGLRTDGICGQETWSSVVEAGFKLGDRLLYRRNPMLHGDDVADLQRRLSTLGFDPGSVDGIFGDHTAAALSDFQHNIGIASDGICGPHTLSELARLSVRKGGEALVSTLRERLRVASRQGSLQQRTIMVGEPGGFQAGAAALSRALSNLGAQPVTFHHPDESEQAEAANLARADCYVGLHLEPELVGVRTAYYRGYRYESEPSRHLAELVATSASKALDLPDHGCQGMALAVLRQTRMPAIVVELGPPAAIAMGVAPLAAAITAALAEWFASDWS
jgi:N-acetylmuramoyl-L-alanine amidase